MRKHISLFLIISVLFCFVSLPTEAETGYPMLKKCEVSDTVNGKYDVNDPETGERCRFSYTVPDGGAVIIVFLFCGYPDAYSGYSILESLAGDPLIDNDSVKIIAVESSGAEDSEVKTFLENCLGEKADRVEAYCSTNLVWAYSNLLGNFGSITPPLLLISGTVNGDTTLLYSNYGQLNFVRFINSVASVCESVTYDEESYLVELKTSGYEMYDQLADIYNRVNEHRANNGLEPLVLSKKLTQLAMQRAAECALYYSHTRPSGDSCFTVDEKGIYSSTGYLNAENIAAGQRSGASVIEAWINSPGHNANILNTYSGSIGIGAYESGGTKYWVQLFGTGSDTETVTENERVYKNHAVTISESSVQSVSASVTLLNVDVGKSAEIPALHTSNASAAGFYADIIPFVDSEVRAGSGELIATISEGNGKLYIKGHRSGEAYIKLYAYEGSSDFVTLHIIVNANALPVIVYGDSDGDGKVTGKDLIRLRKYLASAPGTVVGSGADANGDGVVNGLDLIALRKYFAAYNDENGTSDYPLGPK
ncbi:MAG: hypothetical protein II777_03820 [Clostridia bacterium]|nr:hypothetical protein [Clostridia bacterium]